MKKLHSIYKMTLFLKILSVVVAGTLNIVGIALMTKGYVFWDSFILYSVFVLGGTLVFSMISSNAQRKVFQISLKTFLNSKGIENYHILRKTDVSTLIEADGTHYTIHNYTLKNGVGFILAPAEVEWEATTVLWDNTSKEKIVKFMPGWSSPDWESDSLDVKEEEKQEDEKTEAE